jgi:septum formation protein
MSHAIAPRLILASASPRRAQLLKQLGNDFEIIPSAIEEQQAQETPSNYVKRLAVDKALAVAGTIKGPALIIGSDTLIDYQGHVMEKPRNQHHFTQVLTQLASGTHQVRTAVAVVAIADNDKRWQQVLELVTDVTMGEITAQQMHDYWATGEPADKAGGYAIQGGAARFVRSISGSYTAVVGLPLYETEQLIQQGRQWLESLR